MWNLFVIRNLGFAVSLLTSLAFFAGAWLHFDTLTDRKTLPNLLRWIGLFLLSLAFLISPLNFPVPELIIRSVAYLIIILSLITDPLIPKPQNALIFAVPWTLSYFIPPAFSFVCALLFLRKATVGLERHIMPLAVTFLMLTAAETILALTHFTDLKNPALYALLAPLGPVWIAGQIILLITIFYFQRWVFHYLLKRFQSQIFFIFTTSIVIIFLATTFIFTAVLTRNIQDQSLARLKSNSQTLNLALDMQKSAVQSLAILLSQKSELINALSPLDSPKVSQTLSTTLIDQKLDSLIVASTSGLILFQAEDPNKAGGSISSSQLFQKSLSGQSSVSLIKIASPLVPQLAITAAVPIVNTAKQTVGILLISQILNQAFVDKLHTDTGLDIVLYSENRISAASLTTPPSVRLAGNTLTDPKITTPVLKLGKSFQGETKLSNQLFLASYLPLTDSDKVVLGMLLVGTPARSTLDTIESSLQTAFISAIVLLAISLFPSYLISRYLSKQVS